MKWNGSPIREQVEPFCYPLCVLLNTPKYKCYYVLIFSCYQASLCKHPLFGYIYLHALSWQNNPRDNEITDAIATRPRACKQKFIGHPMYRQEDNKPLQRSIRFPVVHVWHTSCKSDAFNYINVACLCTPSCNFFDTQQTWILATKCEWWFSSFPRLETK